jgi:hypothetical protein
MAQNLRENKRWNEIPRKEKKKNEWCFEKKETKSSPLRSSPT